jgi:patatin-related protein
MPAIDVQEEKRFAVVMYGGVSLAVYMNGVSQELFRLVQSTSAGADASVLKGSANVYSRIAGELKTRFVVDILSGTSAGGINAVFLAKALANGQDFDELESVWMDTADILELINDREGGRGSTRSGSGRKREAPDSLLNGRFMYDELLSTLERMEGPARPPLVRELDLFVTATDLQGIVIPIELSNGTVYERQHRQVFHFRKSSSDASGEERNDLKKENNKFIAFAARSTSSFPFAFAPVQINSVVPMRPEWRRLCRMFPADDSPGMDAAFGSRSFADGGYLDNKPFTYAIEAMTERHAGVPVDRMLVYIEPAPEALSDRAEAVDDPPDAVGNTVLAFTLPRYETIQKDILLIRQRNRFIERVNLILKGTEEDIQHLSEGNQPPVLVPWLTMDMEEMIRQQGFAYGGYFRLRVARLTDELAEIIAGQLAVDVNSDAFIAIRLLIRAWRDERYYYYAPPKGAAKGSTKKERFSAFLNDYDLSFPTRRLAFVLAIIDRLLTEEENAKEVLASRHMDEKLLQNGEFRRTLLDLRDQISADRKAFIGMKEKMKTRASMGSPTSADMTSKVRALRIDPKDLVDRLVRINDETVRAQNALRFVAERSDAFDEFFAAVGSQVGQSGIAMNRCKEQLGLSKNGKEIRWDSRRPPDPAGQATWIVKFYFRFFPHYDSVSLPILQTPDLGEEIDEVKVIRISPESTESLGGLKFGNFGAFLDRTWRKNDLLRGRLDGARGLINALYPGEDENEKNARARYTNEAHLAIVDEWLRDSSTRMDLIAQVMVGATEEDRKKVKEAVGLALDKGESTALSEPFLQAIHGSLTPAEFLKRFENFTVDRSPDAETLARAVSRMTTVGGRVLAGISEGRNSHKGATVSRVLAQAGALAAGLVDVIIPGTWRHLLFRRILYLVMIIAVILMAGQVFLKNAAGLQELGALLFGGSLFLEILRRIVGRLVHREKVTTLVIVVFVIGAGILLVAGAYYLPRAIVELLATFLPGAVR